MSFPNKFSLLLWWKNIAEIRNSTYMNILLYCLRQIHLKRKQFQSKIETAFIFLKSDSDCHWGPFTSPSTHTIKNVIKGIASFNDLYYSSISILKCSVIVNNICFCNLFSSAILNVHNPDSKSPNMYILQCINHLEHICNTYVNVYFDRISMWVCAITNLCFMIIIKISSKYNRYSIIGWLPRWLKIETIKFIQTIFLNT